jgi:hypothetical protein
MPLGELEIWQRMLETMDMVSSHMERTDARKSTFAYGDVGEVIDRFLWLVGSHEDSSLGNPPVIVGLQECEWENRITLDRTLIDTAAEDIQADHPDITLETRPHQVQITLTRDAALLLTNWLTEQVERYNPLS